MKAKALIYAFLIAALSQSVLSAGTTFDGWLYSGQTVTSEGKTFIIYEGTSSLEIMADYGLGKLFMVNNSCQQAGNVRICLDNIAYDLDVKKNKMKVRAISLAPEITITRTADKTEFEAGDGATITVTIKNAGGLAQNLTYKDIFPESVDIISVDGVMKLPHGVIWEERSLKTESVSFSYRIKVNDVMDGKFVATLDYFDGVKMKTIRSASTIIKTSARLFHEFIYKGGSAWIGEKKNITLNFSNRETSTAKISAELFVDSGLALTKMPREFRKAGESHYRADIEIFKSPSNRTYNKTQNYYFEFIAMRTGTFEIRAVSNYSTDDVINRKLSDLKQGITVSDKGVKVRTNFQDLEFESNQARTLRIWLQNLNPEAKLRKVLAELDGGGLVELSNTYIDELAPGAHKKIVEKTFYAPEVDSSKGYTVEVNVSYETEFGDNSSRRFVFTETVNKVESMTITQTLSKNELESGEDATVTIKVKNPRTTKISGIEVKDNISDEFSITGIKNSVIQLGANEEQTAYTYIIKAPRVGSERDYHINTTASYSDEGAAQRYYTPRRYEVEKSSIVTVKPQKFELTAARTVDDSGIYLGDFFDVSYSIKNPSTTDYAENIELFLPIQPEFDIADTESRISLGNLGPGEEITVANKVKRRAKKVGSYALEKAKVAYSNGFGERFEVNVSSTTVKVKDKPNTDTFVFLTKETVEKANNTDFFEVVLNATNQGMSIASIDIEDGSFRKTLALSNGSSAIFTYLKKIDAPGKYSLSPATAAYNFRGKELVAGSDSPEIEIIDNPIISLEKTAPSTAYTSDDFEIELRAVARAGTVRNLTINDGDKKLRYEELSNETSHKYRIRVRKAGAETLPEARGTYIYNGELYETVSNSPVVNVIERQALTLLKSVSVKESRRGDRIIVSVKARNNANDELKIILSDDGKTWEINMAPGEEKTTEYETEAGEMDAATASYRYNDEEKNSTSPIPEFRLIEDENGKVIKEEKEKGALSKMLEMLIRALTWRRG